MQIYHTFTEKTAELSGRPEEVEKTLRLLNELKIPYFGIDHDEASTIELCSELEETLGAKICKNLVLCNRQETEFYFLMLEGDKIFKTKYLSEQIHSSRLSFASPQRMQELLNVLPGSASVLALQNDVNGRVRLLIDRPLLQSEYIGCHPCRNVSTLKLKLSDILEVFLPAVGHAPFVVDLPEPEQAPSEDTEK